MIRTDLAVELRDEAMKNTAVCDAGEIDGVKYYEETRGGATVNIIDVMNDDGSKKLGKPIGEYITLSFGNIADADFSSFCALCSAVSFYISKLVNKSITKPRSVLVCGLGNKNFSADAVGVIGAEHTIITRHIKNSDGELFEKTGFFDICALTPGVLAQTGIETLELIRGAVSTASPDAVIVIDSLAARQTSRLGTTVQLSNTGISPGSGVGNHRAAIDEKTLGVPVYAIGVPMVIDSEVLVRDALDASGYNVEINVPRGTFVCPKDVDSKAELLGSLIGYAINLAFHKNIQIPEMMIM